MSAQSFLASFTNIDWGVVATAAATFIGTMITIIWGWINGHKKLESHLRPEGSDVQIAGAVLQDNTSLRENSQSNRDLRDQVLILVHASERQTQSLDDLTNVVQELLAELKLRNPD